MISRVSLGVRIGYSSSCRSRPRVRIAGCAPAARWRSEARRATTSSSRSAKSNCMVSGGLLEGSRSLWGVIGSFGGSRDSRDLGDGRQAEPDLLEAVVSEAPHALAARDLADLIGRSALEDERADLLAERHELVEADPALVARAAAAPASHRLVGLEVDADVKPARAQRVDRKDRALL